MLALFVLLSLAPIPAANSVQVLPLSSLRGSCKVARSAVNRFGAMRPAAVVDCGCGPHIVTGPISLEGLVNIETTAQALEYVRLFSSHATHDLFQFDGIVEIAGFGDQLLTPDGRLQIEDRFRKRLESQLSKPVVTDESAYGDRRFRVRRVAVTADGGIYELDELVGGNGVYRLLNRRLILKNATDVGILHFGGV